MGGGKEREKGREERSEGVTEKEREDEGEIYRGRYRWWKGGAINKGT